MIELISMKLQEDYLVVVTCSDNKIAYSVAYSLTEKISVSNKRLFTGGLGVDFSRSENFPVFLTVISEGMN